MFYKVNIISRHFTEKIISAKPPSVNMTDNLALMVKPVKIKIEPEKTEDGWKPRFSGIEESEDSLVFMGDFLSRQEKISSEEAFSEALSAYNYSWNSELRKEEFEFFETVVNKLTETK